MAFEINRLHVLADNLNAEVYEWCVESIKSHFDLDLGGWDSVTGYEKHLGEVLTEEQVNEIAEYQTSLSDSGWIEGLAYSALNVIIDQWDNEQPVE
jgi:hypothetical protein|tara:strand:+ start:116 stop:403 length:288 start_codon:yes stop_codon:yes gene_type:complete